MNARDALLIAGALRFTRPAFPGNTRHERLAAQTWAQCVTALAELLAKHVKGFDRAVFFQTCGVSLLACYREH